MMHYDARWELESVEAGLHTVWHAPVYTTKNDKVNGYGIESRRLYVHREAQPNKKRRKKQKKSKNGYNTTRFPGGPPP